jgi:hypothetical protein
MAISKEAILRLAEFDGDRWRKEFDKSEYVPRGDEREFYVGGAIAQHEQLLPLIKALVKDREALRAALGPTERLTHDVQAAHSGAQAYINRVSANATDALLASDARMEGLVGE